MSDHLDSLAEQQGQPHDANAPPHIVAATQYSRIINAGIATSIANPDPHPNNDVPTGWLDGSFEWAVPARARSMLWPSVTIAEPLGPPPSAPGEPSTGNDDPDGHRIIVVDSASLTIEATPPRVVARAIRSGGVLPWLDSAVFFIPKSIREPFVGDLREDQAAMAAEGRSRTAMRWAAMSQVVMLVLRWVWSSGLLRR